MTTKTLKQGLFITLEGGEGVGKSTVLKELLKSLENTSVEVMTSREPGGTKGAEAIRSFVLKPPLEPGWDAMTQLLLFNAARADHLARKIRPALQRGAIVLCDRFSDSTRAYQSAAGGIDAEIVETIDQCVVGDDQPDLTLILDMPLEVAAKRRETRGGETDVFEKLGLDFHQKVRSAFLEIAKLNPKRCRLIDASQPLEDVVAECLSAIEDRWDSL